MTRPRDWSPLGRSSDPIPGDPAAVTNAGKHYSTVADAIKDAARELRRLADDDELVSKARDNLTEKANGVADDIEKAWKRYDEVGDALETYGPKLQTYQDDADALLTKAKDALEAAEEYDNNARTHDRNADDDRATGGDGQVSQDAADRQREKATTQRGIVSQAKKDLIEVERRRDAAAKTAKDAIVAIHKSGGLKDGHWDNWGSKLTKIVQKIASTVALVAGVLALAVSWIPVVGQALAAVLGAIALVATVVSLVCNIVLLANGEGSWVDLGLDVLSLATFGLGRLVGAAGKGLGSAMKGISRIRAGQLGAAPGRGFRAIAGTDDLVNISRNSARSLRNMGSLNKIGRMALDDLASTFKLGPHLRTLSSASNYTRGLSEIPDLAARLRGLGPINAASDLLGHGSLVDDLVSVGKASPELLADPVVRNATNLALGAQGTGLVLGGYEVHGTISGVVDALSPDADYSISYGDAEIPDYSDVE